MNKGGSFVEGSRLTLATKSNWYAKNAQHNFPACYRSCFQYPSPHPFLQLWVALMTIWHALSLFLLYIFWHPFDCIIFIIFLSWYVHYEEKSYLDKSHDNFRILLNLHLYLIIYIVYIASILQIYEIIRRMLSCISITKLQTNPSINQSINQSI